MSVGVLFVGQPVSLRRVDRLYPLDFVGPRSFLELMVLLWTVEQMGWLFMKAIGFGTCLILLFPFFGYYDLSKYHGS